MPPPTRPVLGATIHRSSIARPLALVQSLVESARLGGQVDRGRYRSWPLAAAAALHMARDQRALATCALGAYDALTLPMARLPGDIRGTFGFLAEALAATRDRLDPADVATAARAARRERPDQLIDELIIQATSTPT